MKKPVLLAAFSIFILWHTNLFAQNKTLGVGVATPNPNAALHVESPTGNQGFILPRLTSAQRFAASFISALSTTDNGLMVYDTDLKTIFIWDGTAWKNTGQVAGGVKLTFPYYDSVAAPTGTNDLFSLKYNNAETKRILRIENQNPTNPGSALSVTSAGMGSTGYFQSSNPTNASSTVYATTNSDAGGDLAPVAVYGESTGIGSLGGSFRINNAGNVHPALFAETIGAGPSIMAVTSTGFAAIQGEATGGWSNGVAGISQSADPGSFAVLGQNNGGGPAGVFSISNATNTSSSLEGSTSGLGTAGLFRIKNPANKANVIFTTTSGSGAAIDAENTGTGDGFAGNFRVTSATNNYPALQASSAGMASGIRVIQDVGTGPGMDVMMNNPGSLAPGIAIDQLGMGNGGTFTVNNATNSSHGVSSITNGLGSAGVFEQTNTSSATAALVARANGQGVAFSAIVPANSANAGAAEFTILNDANGKNAITATTEGNGSAGFFQINGSWNPAPALSVQTLGSGAAITASTSTGFTAIEGIQGGVNSGSAARFVIVNSTNSQGAVEVTTAGTGPGVQILHTGASGDGLSVTRTGAGIGSAGNFTVAQGNMATALLGTSYDEAGKGLAASNESNGIAFALIAGGIQVTTYNVNTASITTRAMAYHITGGGTVFTFNFIPIPSGDGELYMVYNDTGAQINVEGVQINNGEGKTIINFGGTFRGFRNRKDEINSTMKYLYLGFWISLAFTPNAQFISNNGIRLTNSALIVTNGEWTNDAGTNILNNGIISTTESFINNGTLDKSSTGGFDLDFAIDLNFQPGGGEMGFLTKNGPGIALVGGSIGVKDSLLIKNGIIRMLNAADTVWLKSGALLSSSATSYIEAGFIARGGSGDLLFPFGKDGLYLPLKMYKVQAEKLTASVLDAPPGHTAGPGVDALIGFPYTWRVTKKLPADTAAYVEIDYPSTLPVVVNPIVAREIPGAEYASMGARNIEDSGTRITVKSYSRRTNGLFTVAQGFPSDPVTDSLALVALFQKAGGETWTDRTNWLTGTIDTWYGVTVAGQSITNVDLSNNNLQGPVADPIVDILSLQTVNLSGNELTSLPDFTLNPEISALNVSDNNLDFASLEPNAAITGIHYLIQGDVGTPMDTAIQVNSSYLFDIEAGGQSSEYTWKFNGETIPEANGAAYLLPAISRATMGEYIAEITNPNLPGLILKSAVQKVLAYANVSGKLFVDTDFPAEQGTLTLYRVQPGAFEPVATVNVQSDGSYNFEEVILDDYQLRGFADTLLYDRALPTYYNSTIFWEEADTLYLEDNINTLDIVSHLEPGPPSGRGSISGYLQEDDGTGRVKHTEKNKRIAGVGVSARRVERTGRTKDEILTLVAYVYTDENGEFTLPNLPVGEYRLNFQYPGYPMDETSYITIFIGTAFDSQVMVEANVKDRKIHVRPLVITGLYQAEGYSAEVYPNPSSDFIRLKFPAAITGRVITLSDLNGKTAYSMDAVEEEASVSVRNLQKGIYIMQIRENGIKVKTLKVSIE